MIEAKRFCVDCKATKTPMWRSGPLGPRSLCNACGIRYRKRKIADENPNLSSSESIRREKASTSSNNLRVDDDERNQSMNMRLNHPDNELILQRSSASSSSSSPSSKWRRERNKRKLGEVEEAARLLMSLSCGSVSA